MSKRVASGLLPVITVDRSAPKALHRQIYEALRLSIVEGRLQRGQRVPSTRLLALEVGVSRLPVLNAYAQLRAEGYLQAKPNSGTIVATTLPDEFTSPALTAHRTAHGARSNRKAGNRSLALPTHPSPAWIREPGAFGVGQVAYDQFPVQTWSKIVSRRAKSMSLRSFSYGDPLGSTNLRANIAAYLRTARAVRCDVDQILIVSGSQQAIALAAQVLINDGDSVWMEDPGYAFSRDAFALAGAKTVPVPVDEEGLNVSAGIRMCRGARVAIVTPSHQFPMGATMSAARRRELLKWAQENGSWIVEDDYDSEFRYESSPVPSLQGMDSDDRVIYVGTFSKILFPSLRLGYIVVPADLVERFSVLRRASDLSPPGSLQEVVAEFIGEGHFERHIRRMRVLYHERRDILVHSLSHELGDAGTIHGAKAGTHFAITFPGIASDYEIAAQAAAQKLWLWPLSAAYLQDAPEQEVRQELRREVKQGFILGFGGTPASSIPTAVSKLAGLTSLRKYL
jgi:GntR family transcriptional regulator/MocR family aminotransferase